jgi:hypothetical protein
MITKKDTLKQVLLNCRSILVSNDKLSPDGIYDELEKARENGARRIISHEWI